MMLTREQLFDLFWVNLGEGKLYWRNPPKNHPRLRNKEAGQPIPNHNGKEYWVIRIGKKGYKRGHLIYFLTHGEAAKPCLDHINGNSLDDRAENLRPATVQQNAQNHKKRAKASSLPMGVRLIPGSGRFQARISLSKKQIHLGAYDTPEEAAAVYVAKRKELFNEFA